MITEPLKRLQDCYWMKPRSFVAGKFLELYSFPPAVRILIQGKDFLLKPSEVVTEEQKESELTRMKKDKFEKQYAVEIDHIRASVQKHGFKKLLSETLEIPYSRVFLIFRKSKAFGIDLCQRNTNA